MTPKTSSIFIPKKIPPIGNAEVIQYNIFDTFRLVSYHKLCFQAWAKYLSKQDHTPLVWIFLRIDKIVKPTIWEYLSNLKKPFFEASIKHILVPNWVLKLTYSI